MKLTEIKDIIQKQNDRLNLEIRLKELEHQMKMQVVRKYKNRETIDVDKIIDMLRGATITIDSYNRIRHALNCCLINEEDILDGMIEFDTFKKRRDAWIDETYKTEEFIEESEMNI